MSAASSIGVVPREALIVPPLKARRLGIDTHQEAVVYMRADCHVCRAEGLTPHARVLLTANGREVIGSLHHVSSDLLGDDEAGLSEAAWHRLGVAEGDMIRASHPQPLESLGASGAASMGIGSMTGHSSRSCPTW